MTLKFDTGTDTLTLNVPQDLDADKRLRLAVALFDAQLLTQGQAAEMTGLSRVEFYDALGRFGVTPFQYSWEEAFAEADMPEAWETRLHPDQEQD